jgi:hypothetical protein
MFYVIYLFAKVLGLSAKAFLVCQIDTRSHITASLVAMNLTQKNSIDDFKKQITDAVEMNYIIYPLMLFI